MAHEHSFTEQTSNGKYMVFSSLTLQPLTDVEFDSQANADKYAEDRSFRFGLRLDETRTRHADADGLTGKRTPDPTMQSTVQHGTSLLDGE